MSEPTTSTYNDTVKVTRYLSLCLYWELLRPLVWVFPVVGIINIILLPPVRSVCFKALVTCKGSELPLPSTETLFYPIEDTLGFSPGFDVIVI